MTPGQAAYEAAVATGHVTVVAWDDRPHMYRRAWEAIAQAAIKAHKADRAAQIAEWEHVTSTAGRDAQP